MKTSRSRMGAGRSRLLGVMVVLAVLSVSCTGDGSGGTSGTSTTDAGDAEAPASTAGPGDRSRLVVAIGEGDSFNWDPAADNEKASIHFGDTLTQFNSETGLLEGALAESWESSEDGTTWTFRLRPDVQFHDDWGALTAEDVKFTWSEWISEESDHRARAVAMRQAVDGDMDNFEIVSDLEFRVHTTNPIVTLPSVLCSCNTGMTVTSARYFEEVGEEVANTHPIGTGPWQFVSSNPGVEMILAKVDAPHPFRETPAYDELEIRIIPDGAARWTQVQSGAIDIADLGGGLGGEVEAAGLQIVSNKASGHLDLQLGGMYFGDPALDVDSPWIQGESPDSEAGRAIREAISLAIDRDIILERLLFGQGAVSHAPLFSYPSDPLTFDESWELPVYDPELARQRLADGGYPDGFPIELLMFAEDVDTVSIGEAVAGMLEEIGIEVIRTPIEADAVEEVRTEKATEGMAWLNVAGWYPNPNNTVFSYTSTWVDDDFKLFYPPFDETYEILSAEPDFEAQWETGRALLEQMVADAIMINMMALDMPFVLSENIASFTPMDHINTINSLETVRPVD